LDVGDEAPHPRHITVPIAGAAHKKNPGNSRANGEKGATAMLRFNDLFRDPTLGITASGQTRWIQGKIIPAQVLQAYWDAGLPFLPEAPITAMRLGTFQRKLEELAQGHDDPSVRQLAAHVGNDLSISVSGYDRAGKPDPRRVPKVKVMPPRYDKR
jgi:hypothetical protein